MLPQHLAEAPHHYWCAATQAFYSEIKSNGIVVARYIIPRHVFFAIHADMARAIKDCPDADAGAQILPMRKEADGH
jgi:hypothetical protein